jgi:sugar phosphate isomerase/epimerase
MLKAKDKWPLSVCSWSLRIKPEKLPGLLNELGSPLVHLALDDLLDKPQLARKLAGKLAISATMIGFSQEDYTTLETIKETGGILPNNCWESNLLKIRAGIELTSNLGVKFMSFHAGFIDESQQDIFSIMCERIRTAADIAAFHGITILMETGQETADDLAAFLAHINHTNLGVNFDPANMILYGKGDPIEAVKKLAPWVKHIHIKDAVASASAGEWGKEVPWGKGEVGAARFTDALAAINYAGAVAIEREAGDSRMEDIKSALAILTAE